jgi:hypothetical protein
MIVSNENSNDIPTQQNESKLKPSQIVTLSSGVQTCEKDNKECRSMLKSSRSIAVTTLPILNKLPNSNTVDANFFNSAKVLPNVCSNNFTANNFNLPNLNLAKHSMKSMAFYNNYSTKDPARYTNNFTKNEVSHNTQTWPFAGQRYPGFKPLGYRTRPTFGEQCLKTGNQWPGPREEPGPSLPYLDLFTDDPIGDKCSEPVKNDVIAKPIKPVSWIRKNRFPALFDSYNIHNGLFNLDGKSHPIIGALDKKDQTIPSPADFPVVTSCKLNKVVNEEMDKNAGLREVFQEDCSECPLCRKQAGIRARIGDVSNSNSPKYHIHLPSTD